MGEEVRIAEYNGGGGDEDRVFEWEDGLPSADDLTPLTQLLIPPELASAFRITPEPYRSMGDVNRASQNTLSSLSAAHNFNNNNNSNNFKSFNEEQLQPIADMETDPARDSRKIRRIEQGNCVEEAENNISSTDDGDGDGGGGGGGGGRTIKRPRLVWTPQLHKRFIDVVAHLGVKNAVPKTIMQLMNVEGLTRENVASHLQKYRLYLKRMQGLSNEGPSASDHLFASTPLPQQSSHESGHSQQNNSNGHIGMPMQIPMPYPPQMMGMTGHGGHGHGGYHGYNMMQQRDWSGNKFGSIAPYHHLAPNDK